MTLLRHAIEAEITQQGQIDTNELFSLYSAQETTNRTEESVEKAAASRPIVPDTMLADPFGFTSKWK